MLFLELFIDLLYFITFALDLIGLLLDDPLEFC
jgi:hypothetical protein